MSNEKLNNFQLYRKYSYSYVSNPNNNFKQKLQQFWILFKNNSYKSVYINDCKYFTTINSNNIDRHNQNLLSKYIIIYNIIDIPFTILLIFSLNNHYKKGYLSTSNKILNYYILIKYIIYIYLFYCFKFFTLKYFSDPIIYNYYLDKELRNKNIIENNTINSISIINIIKNIKSIQ